MKTEKPCAWCYPMAPGDPPASHGICRYHELEQYKKSDLITWDERLELRAICASRVIDFIPVALVVFAAAYGLYQIGRWVIAAAI